MHLSKNTFFPLILLILLFFKEGNVCAQAVDGKGSWKVFFSAGTAQYDGDYGSEVFKFNRTQTAFLGMGLSKRLTERFELDLGLNNAKLDYEHVLDRDGINRAPTAQFPAFSTNFTSFSTNLKFIDSAKDLFPFLPFQSFIENGFFVGRTNNRYNEPQFQKGLHAGIGFIKELNSSVSLELGLRYNWFLFDKHAQDAIEGFGSAFEFDNAAQDEFLATTFTIKKRIGSKKKNKPASVLIFNAIDSDGDGLTDEFDACPDIPGEIETYGCPDNDKDGIENSKDACIDVAGLPSADGCPDQDFDGITDAFDDCPTVAGNTLSGCLDSDEDGILETNDHCPFEAGFASFNGCNKGTLRFEIDSLALSEQQRLLLSQLVNEVKEKKLVNASLVIKIEGYTDSTGPSGYNLLLSKNRAERVAEFITEKSKNAGLSIVVSTFFFGEMNPLNNNKTMQERAENRRVELQIVTK